jgi:alpha-L-rhamnosidase
MQKRKLMAMRGGGVWARAVVVCAIVVVWLGGESLWGQTAGEPAPWKAEWITAAGAPQRDEVVLHFRKVIEVGAVVPRKFVVEVSADNQFVLFVNEKRVGIGPSKSDLAHWRFETFDIGPYLKVGKNVLAATVWNFGTHAALAQMSDRVGFLVHGASAVERAVDTDASWDVEVEKGIAALRPELPGFYFAAGPGERWDAGKMDWDWNREAGRENSEWTKAVTLGRGALRWERDAPNNWQLVSDPLPAMEMKEVASGKVVRATGMTTPEGFPENGFVVPAHTKVSALLDHGKLVTGYPELSVTGGVGSRIRLTYAEALYDAQGQKGNRNEIQGKHILGLADEFLLGGNAESAGMKAGATTEGGSAGKIPALPGEAEFMPLGWKTWRYLQIDVEAGDHPVKIGPLKTWSTAYPFEEKGYFRAGNESLKKIWEIGWRTARLDAHDTYMDTPYWERLQYVGDTRIQTLVSYAVAGDDRLARQAIIAFNHSRIPDGLTQSRYPSSLVQMIPTFSLMWVGMVHDFWRYRGDEDLVRAQLPGTRTVLDWFVARQRRDGLLEKIPWWPFVDWGKDFRDGVPEQGEDGGSSVITLQFVEALRYGAEMEAAYGDKHVAELYRAAADLAVTGIWKSCWNEKYGLLADTPSQDHFSQHVNILGVWLDVIPREKQQEVLNKILSASDKVYEADGPAPSITKAVKYVRAFQAAGPVPEMTLATYYFRFYLARALEHAGMGERYLLLLGPWQRMVELGLTTWAESPEPTRSDSHAWSAHPNFDLLTIVAGIQPESAGFAKVRIEPHLGVLKYLEAGMPTPRGMVEVSYARSDEGLEAEVTLPVGVTGELEWEGKVVELHGGEQRVVVK